MKLFMPVGTGVSSGNGLLNNLVSYYKMDTNGSFPDANGSNNGTISGATFTASGKINGGYNFDGTNDQITGNIDISGFTEISVNLWTNSTITAGTDMVFSLLHSGNDDIRMSFDSDNKCNFSLDDGTSYNIQGSLTSGLNMYTLTFDGSTLKAYENEVEIGSGISASFNFSTSSGNFAIGNRSGGSLYFSGLVDEIYVGEGALTQTKITALYNGGAGLSYNSFTS